VVQPSNDVDLDITSSKIEDGRTEAQDDQWVQLKVLGFVEAWFELGPIRQ